MIIPIPVRFGFVIRLWVNLSGPRCPPSVNGRSVDLRLPAVPRDVLRRGRGTHIRRQVRLGVKPARAGRTPIVRIRQLTPQTVDREDPCLSPADTSVRIVKPAPFQRGA